MGKLKTLTVKPKIPTTLAVLRDDTTSVGKCEEILLANAPQVEY
jgi:hypothetical protein